MARHPTPNMRILAAAMHGIAEMGVWRGTDGLVDQIYYRQCCQFDGETGTVLIFTRDVGMHSCGWFKNPDYERCRHLSLSFRNPVNHGFTTFDDHLAERWVRAFFDPEELRCIWEESAHSDAGQLMRVRHYRVFCDEHWQPIVPRGEVYSTDFTEKGWKSWSDRLHDERKAARRFVEAAL